MNKKQKDILILPLIFLAIFCFEASSYGGTFKGIIPVFTQSHAIGMYCSDYELEKCKNKELLKLLDTIKKRGDNKATLEILLAYLQSKRNLEKAKISAGDVKPVKSGFFIFLFNSETEFEKEFEYFFSELKKDFDIPTPATEFRYSNKLEYYIHKENNEIQIRMLKDLGFNEGISCKVTDRLKQILKKIQSIEFGLAIWYIFE